jgi:hypothetical protein
VSHLWGYLSLLAVVIIGLLPPLILVQYGRVSSWWLIAGGAVWVASLAVKWPLSTALASVGHERLRVPTSAVFQGLLSALVELGAAAVYLRASRRGSLADVFAFGVGAGCVEALYVVILAVILGARGSDPDNEAAWAAGATVSLCVRYALPIERVSALLGHAGSRGLVYLSVSTVPLRGIPLFILALLLFAIVDGIASYGLTVGWNWNDPCVCRRFYSFVFSISLIEAVLFLLLFSFLALHQV